MLYKMNFAKGKNHTISLYYLPNCRVTYLDEFEEQTEEEKSKEISAISKKKFNPPTVIETNDGSILEEVS